MYASRLASSTSTISSLISTRPWQLRMSLFRWRREADTALSHTTERMAAARPPHPTTRWTDTMSIILPEQLASAALLRGEGIEVLQQPSQDSAVLRIGLLNLMPDKTRTEVQFGRLLGATGRQVELVLGLPASYRRDVQGMERYARWGEASLRRNLDGLVVPRAPPGRVPCRCR